MTEKPSSSKRTRKSNKGIQRTVKGVQRSAKNALTLLRQGRLTSPYRASYEVVIEHKNFRLRHYTPQEEAEAPPLRQPLLLIPPLMLTSEVYDISPELSVVTWLMSQGVDVWLCDFGRPEAQEGGLERTLDDHVLAVDACIDEIGRLTGEKVHLAGYSQGGMFVYQTAAYRRSEGLASILTFGSPVDVRRMIPIAMPGALATRVLAEGRRLVDTPLQRIKGLPGYLTSTGFKLLSVSKEIEQIGDFFKSLGDREALARREPRRRFLNGEGFVAWPAPALRRVIDEVVVKNLMAQGGLVINKRPVTLADITVPTLIFVGLSDEIARPASVRAVYRSAPNSSVHEVSFRAGHFGLVVGSKALSITWPKVVEWLHWQEGSGEMPTFGLAEERTEPSEDGDGRQIQEMYEAATDLLDSLWTRVGDATYEMSDTLETMRWQLPRLARMRRITDTSRLNPGRALSDQARAIGENDFFLWGDRAWTYGEANARVNSFANLFHERGIQAGDHVGVLMNNHPDYLTTVVALNRIGAISVLINAGATGASLRHAIAHVETKALIIDEAHSDAREIYRNEIWRLGSQEMSALEGVTDLHPLLDPEKTTPPAGIPIDQGLGHDTAFLMFTSGTTGLPRAARITNRRWASAALSTAAGLRLTDRDTVYCSLPLYHSTGLLVGCGGALVGGARLALAPKFSTSTFWNDVHRYGATIVIYIGELCRYLVNAPPTKVERTHAVRAFAGNGMREDVWREVIRRFGRVEIKEFYGSTEGNIAIANLEGKKIGSVGRPILPESEIALVAYDYDAEDFARDDQGHLVRAQVGTPGVLLSRISNAHPFATFDGYVDGEATESRVLRDVFEAGDEWFNTGDMLRADEDGDLWFVDRLGETWRWKGENVSTEEVSRVLMGLEGIAGCAAYGVKLPKSEGRAGMVALKLGPGHVFDGKSIAKAVEQHLFPAARPLFVRLVEDLPMTSTLKLIKRDLQGEGADPRKISDALYYFDERAGEYRTLSAEKYEELTASL